MSSTLTKRKKKKKKENQNQKPQKENKGQGLFGEVMDMLSTLVVVIVLQMYAYVQTYHNIYFKWVQFSIYKLYLNKAIKWRY